jgi:hypothetical protein
MLAMQIIRVGGLAALFPLLAACAAGASIESVQTVEAACLAQYPTYSGAWHCARDHHAGTWDEYRARYVANGDALLDRVNRGQISDANARAVMSRAGGRR